MEEFLFFLFILLVLGIFLFLWNNQQARRSIAAFLNKTRQQVQEAAMRAGNPKPQTAGQAGTSQSSAAPQPKDEAGRQLFAALQKQQTVQAEGNRQVEAKLAAMQLQLQNMEQGLSDRLAVIEQQLQWLQAKVQERQQTASAPVVAYPHRCYARQADLTPPAGFDVKSCSSSSYRAFYCITLHSATEATFDLTAEAKTEFVAQGGSCVPSQTYAFENNPPYALQRIETTAPGRLVLQQGKWVINSKISLRYV